METLNKSQKKYALYSGIEYVIIFITAIYANFYVLEGVLGNNQTLSLASAINQNIAHFELGKLAFFTTMILDVFLAWQLYQITKETNKELAVFSALLRLIYAAILGIGLYHLSQMTWLASNLNMADDLKNFELLSHKMAFNKIWVMGLVFFGIHLVLMGKLFCAHPSFSKWIAFGLFIAGTGYIADGAGQLILANYQDWAFILDSWVLIGGVTGEMAFMVYLFIIALRKES